jgi:hypothetical protein
MAQHIPGSCTRNQSMHTTENIGFGITTRIVLPLLAIVMESNLCDAVPYDLIVPSEVVIRAPSGICGVGSPWGWVIATESPLSFGQLNGCTINLSTDDPSIIVSTTFCPWSGWAPMMPGDVAGTDVSAFTAAMHALLRPGEVVNPLSENFWRWDIAFNPYGYVPDETILHTVFEIDGAQSNFDTVLRFDPSYGAETDVLGIVAAQRVTAVPEPYSWILVLAAVPGLSLFLPRRKKASMTLK